MIQLPFPTSLSNVSVTRGAVNRPSTTDSAGPDQSGSNAATVVAAQQVALETLAAIDQKIQSLAANRQDDFSAVGAQLVAAATQIAREALGSENSLIEQRVTHFADVLLRQIHPKQSAVFFVNPDCVAILKNWIDQSEVSDIEIQADATVPPGDCRIELDDKGFLASLESFLDAAGKRTALLKGQI
ncbi:MAG: hypothetical protein KDB00_08315 [Planctomycetales bacterium]|nr:hypothetical protein [Planctomycetales bacterium]